MNKPKYLINKTRLIIKLKKLSKDELFLLKDCVINELHQRK